MHSSYYDIDSILSEEEMISCTALFDFYHLGHLSSDTGLSRASSLRVSDDKGVHKRAKSRRSLLAENSRLKMPLWSVEKWANLGFVRLSIPKHFSRRARERLATDPGSADLRWGNLWIQYAIKKMTIIITKQSCLCYLKLKLFAELEMKDILDQVFVSPTWFMNVEISSLLKQVLRASL